MGALMACLQIVTMAGRVLHKYTLPEGITAYLYTMAARRAVMFCYFGDRLWPFWGRFWAFGPFFSPPPGCLLGLSEPVWALLAAILVTSDGPLFHTPNHLCGAEDGRWHRRDHR